MVEVAVARLGIDRASNTPVVFLRERDGPRTLPIWIGAAEASAIAMELQGVRAERPMTHDLCKALLAGLGGTLQRVSVTHVRDNTYFAELLIARDAQLVAVDARPSDAIALALRARAPIFVADVLLGDGDGEGGAPAAPDDGLDPEALKRHLERLDPQDFGKFRQ